MGIGLELVRRIEDWFRENGAEYSYIATENDNHPSVNLFTNKCGYSKFRTPSILVQPVFAHRVRVNTRVTILKLTPSDAESLYRRRFSTTEFFPRDIDSVLNNILSLGTFVAVPKGFYFPGSWPGLDRFLSNPPDSWAVLSVWNCQDVFKLEVRGASRVKKGLAKTTRLVDRAFPWASCTVGARSVSALWASLFVWAWRGRPNGGEVREGPLWVRAQFGQEEWVWGGGDRSVKSRSAQVRHSTLEGAIVRRGPLVYQEAWGRLQRRIHG